jgi:cytochrome c oxidase subunit IV
MTTTSELHEAETHDDAEEHGLSDFGYVKVAIFLAVLTALEVSTYYFDFGPFFIPVLLILMAIKFVTVVSYFMHLKFDNRMYSFMFYAGLGLALIVYLGTLATFQFFLSS